MIKTTHTIAETEALATEIAHRLRGGEVLCLHGDMGAGKTTFTNGLVQALHGTSAVSSPTFTLMNLYPAAGPAIKTIVHIDTYRLENEAELVAIGAEDYIGTPGTVTVIEWPEKVNGLLHDTVRIDIYFEHGDKGSRSIRYDEAALPL